MRARHGLPALAVLLVALMLGLARERTSPGALAQVHAREQLETSGRCTDCHADAGRSMADACSTCHADVAASIAAGRGLHGQLGAGLARDCARCHAEHEGPNARMADAPAFARAGFASIADYRHEGLDFGLEGAHAALRCGQCHAHAAADPLPADTPRFLGLSQSCTTCHADPHAGRYGADCASCHGQELPFKTMDGLDHDHVCPLVGSHRKADCKACHRDGSAHAVDVLAERRAAAAAPAAAPAAARDCLGCHVSPHRDGFVQRVVEQLAAAPAGALGPASAGTSCNACHGAAHESFAGRPADMQDAWHAASGFALDKPHAGLRCESCHASLGRRAPLQATFADDGPRPAPDTRAFHADFPGRTPDDCRACHADVHRGQFEAGPFAGQGCLACHAREAFTPVAFDDAHHARTSFPLTGAHLAVGCNACHLQPGEPRLGAPRAAEASRSAAPREFAGTPGECAACHADMHAGGLAGPGQPAEVGGATGCARCHSTSAWDELSVERFDHALWTGFALDGAHARAACVACHVPGRAAAGDERQFGRAAGRNCNDCHAPGSVRPEGLGGDRR